MLTSTENIIYFTRLDREFSGKVTEPRHLHPPLDIKYTRALLDPSQTLFHDQWIEPLKQIDLLQKIKSSRAQIVVIRATSFCFEESLSLALELKNLGLTTIAIGQQTSHLMKLSEDLVRNTYDFIIHGESEVALYELIKKLEGVECEVIRDSYWEKFKTNYHNIVEAPDELPILEFTPDELARYPFPFPIRDGFYKKWAYVLTAWGCPHKCDFCTLIVRKSAGDNLRRRSPEKIVSEIEAHVKDGADFIVIEDDTFFCNKQHLRAVCNLIISKGIKVSWMCNSRIDEIDEDSIIMAKRAGLKLVKVGIETGSPRVIEKLGKSKDGHKWLTQIQSSFEIFQKHSIGTIGLFMVATPGEKIEDFKQTLDLLKKISPDYIQVQIFTAYPDIKYFKDIEHQINVNKNLYHYKATPVRLSEITEYSEAQLQNILYRSYYINLKFIARHLFVYWRYYIRPSYSIFLAKKIFQKFSILLSGERSEA